MDLVQSDIETIEELASQNYTKREIALVLDIKPSLFTYFCADELHSIGKAYMKGHLEIERAKNEKLLTKIESGSETAIQIHDKKAKKQAFLDMKNDLYSGLDDE